MNTVRMMLLVAMVMLVMSVSWLSGAEAETPGVSCLRVSGGSTKFGDAAAVVNLLRTTPGQCCQTSLGFCTKISNFGDATVTVCVDVGEGLNQVLAQCNQLNTLQGEYSPDGTSQQLFYITSAFGAKNLGV
jgi:hypothetical protein